MSADSRFMTAGIVLGILGIGIGIGIVIASFMIGLGTTQGSALSSSGTTTVIVFVVLTVILSAAARRQKRIGGRDETL